jgi:hypothetical protein
MKPDPDPNSEPAEKRDKTFIKAFTFAGAILGTGLFGLAKTVVLLAATEGWVREGTGVGAFYYWLLAGAGAGFLVAWGLVRARGPR